MNVPAWTNGMIVVPFAAAVAFGGTVRSRIGHHVCIAIVVESRGGKRRSGGIRHRHHGGDHNLPKRDERRGSVQGKQNFEVFLA